jgi:ferredoxin
VNAKAYIEPSLCAGDACGYCEQMCPQKAISA